MKMKAIKNNKLKLFMLVCLALFTLVSNSAIVFAQEIHVTLPPFNVTINGVRIENQYRKYPFILYKNITYFPMTYVDSRFLGLETKWNRETGLEVFHTKKAGSYGNFEPELLEKKNGNSYRASIPTFTIQVNGKGIQNTREPYPLIVFRDVTYFPLTWRFGVEEFGWEYGFTKEEGLKINSFTPPPAQGITYPLVREKVLEDHLKVAIYQHRMPSPGNLYLSTHGGAFQQLGDPNLIYGVVGEKDQESGEMTLRSDDYMEFREGWLYVQAMDYSQGGKSTLYKINIETGETLVVE